LKFDFSENSDFISEKDGSWNFPEFFTFSPPFALSCLLSSFFYLYPFQFPFKQKKQRKP